MKPLRMVTLCSGIGAPELAAHWVNDAIGEVVYKIAGQVEIDPFACAVLEKNFPGIPRLHDIREVEGHEFGTVNVVVAGFPCQPVSHAGKRGGPGDARWLWADVYRFICNARPAWAIFENVSGLISLGLDTVLRDMEVAGYAAWTFVFPASVTGAPHNRERVFVVAHAVSQRRQRIPDVAAGNITDRQASRWPQGASRTKQSGENDVAYAGRTRQSPGRISGGYAALGEMGDDRLTDGSEDVAYASSKRERGAHNKANAVTTGGEAWSVPFSRSKRRHVDNRHAEPRMGRTVNGLSRWLDSLKWPAYRGCEQYDWEKPRTTPKSKRVEHRADRIKALGNAIVPQQIFPVLWTIAAMHVEDAASVDGEDATDREIAI